MREKTNIGYKSTNFDYIYAKDMIFQKPTARQRNIFLKILKFSYKSLHLYYYAKLII